MRQLSLEEIQEKFDNYKLLHNSEVDYLFDTKHKLTKLQYRYLTKGIRYQGIWDIETSDFDPLSNFIICYDITIRDILTGKLEKLEDSITKHDISSAVRRNTFNFDYRLLETLSYNLRMCDQAIGHYSVKFDTPYFRSRCLQTGQDHLIPDYDELRYGDTWRMMKYSIKSRNNKLGSLPRYVNIKQKKTFVDMEHWKRIYFPSASKWQKSMNYILVHCRADVEQTLGGILKMEKFNPIQTTRL